MKLIKNALITPTGTLIVLANEKEREEVKQAYSLRGNKIENYNPGPQSLKWSIKVYPLFDGEKK